MPTTLTTDFALPNGKRLEYPGLVKGLDDETGIWTIRVELRTSVPNGRRFICATELQIRDGTCHVLAKHTPLPEDAGLHIHDPKYYFEVSSRIVATGFTDAWAAVRTAANTPAAREAAAVAHLFSAGHLHSSLAGT